MKMPVKKMNACYSSRRKKAAPALSSCQRRNAESRKGRRSKRQRTAALQDLAEGVTRNLSRQRLGVRLSSAAFVTVVPA